MIENKGSIEETSSTSCEVDDGGDKLPARYFINVGQADGLHRSLPLMIAGRQCYTCAQGDTEALESSDPKPYMERITEHCAETPDYLLPDTPIKEAIFRVLLAGANNPMLAEEISTILSDKWTMSAYPRDISPLVIEKLLIHSENYCITRASEPLKD